MKRNIFVVLLLSLFLSACDQGEPQGYSIISVTDAYQLVKDQDKGTIFLDVRTPGEYQSGHVPHAKLIPVQTLANRLNEVPKDKKIVVYCESGVRATRAAELLVNQGYTNVLSMKASMRGWRSAGLPTEK
ncbi:rhodanese-like domain-containing protein [Ghiorsea bivora]|uniref:rhodanese-like domain-containing protein n=1 Tax=Ghiorsea bivora TaxID=1485545 RepID=UPI00056F4AE6|nr:rhodanese-like domain-containing protein [Ghiorsea bivora]